MHNRESIVIDSRNVAFISTGSGPPIVLLHGWGGNADSWNPVTSRLARQRRVIVIDLPGFGESDLPPYTWGLKDYAECVLGLLHALGVEKFDVMGHSFGGRLAIWLGAHHPERINRMTLVNAAGVKWNIPLKYYINMYAFNVLTRSLYLLRLEGKIDMFKLYSVFWAKWGYQIERTLPLEVNVNNQFLESLLPKILCPTLIVYGENDGVTPISFGKTLERSIGNSALIILPSAGHFSYLDQFSKFIQIIESFHTTTEL